MFTIDAYTSAADFLGAYRTARARADRLAEQAVAYRTIRMSAGAIRYSGLPRGTDISDLSDYMVRLEEMTARTIRAQAAADAILRLIRGQLTQITDNRQREAVFRMCVLGQRARDAAADMGICRSHVYRLRDAGLAVFEPSDTAILRAQELLVA